MNTSTKPHVKLALISALALLLVTACSTNNQAKQDITIPPLNMADIYEVKIRASSVWFVTRSNGCTSANNFELYIQNTPANQTNLTITQLKPDLCKGMTRLINIELPLVLPSHAHNIVVTNPIQTKSDKLTPKK